MPKDRWLKQRGSDPACYCPVEETGGSVSVVTGMNYIGEPSEDEIVVGEFWYEDRELKIEFYDEGRNLKVCPFCAHDRFRLLSWPVPHGGGHGSHEEYAFYCLNCSARGPNGVSEKHACEMWNMRRPMDELMKELKLADRLIDDRNRVLKQIPPCKNHGNLCLSHHQDWIRTAKEFVELMRDYVRTHGITEPHYSEFEKLQTFLRGRP